MSERFRWRTNPEVAAHLADGVKCLELDNFEFTMDNIPAHTVEGCQCVIEPIDRGQRHSLDEVLAESGISRAELEQEIADEG